MSSECITATPDALALRGTDLDLAVTCILRYTMGRSTYIVGWAIATIKSAWPLLTPEQRNRHMREVCSEITRTEGRGALLGMAFDHSAWQSLAVWMKENKGGMEP